MEGQAVFIFLKGDFETIRKRLEARGGHFMPTELLQSQFDDLEIPENALVFDIKNKPMEIVNSISEKIKPPTFNNQ